MSPAILTPSSLSRDLFDEFGYVIEKDGSDSFLINGGRTRRYDALSPTDITDGIASISIFAGEPSALPIEIEMMERHPLGSQAFYPLDSRPWLVVVASDEGGAPGHPKVFLASGDQGVSYNRNVWHYPLLCLEERSDFLVIDRGGDDNLEEFTYPTPYTLKF